MEAETLITEGEGYSVVHRGGCVIARGPLPFDVFAEIYQHAGDGAGLDIDTARMAKATLVLGKPDDLAALREALAPGLRAEIAADPDAAHLSPPAREWLATGRQGLSSAAMFLRTLGYRPRVLKPTDAASHPHDPDDLDRCLRLCEAVPEVGEQIEAMRGLSPQWDALVTHWNELRALFNEEFGPDQDPTRNSSITYERMQALGL